MAKDDAKIQMQYAEELIREFLLFRGFTNTLQSFEADLSSDHAQAFQVDQILTLFFSVYIPRYEEEKMHSILEFLQKCFFSPFDAQRALALRKFETSLKRYYIIHALQKGRVDRVVEFFERHGPNLLQNDEDWQAWFALPYIKNPQLDSHFQLYFSREWLDMLLLSFGNFLNEVFDSIRQPALVTVSAELQSTKDLKRKVEELSTGFRHLRESLATKEQEISDLKGELLKCTQQLNMKTDGKTSTTLQAMQSSGSEKERINRAESVDHTFPQEYFGLNKQVEIPSNLTSEEASLVSMSPTKPSGVLKETLSDGVAEDELLEIPFESQESFSGHTSPISRCRFSAGGGNIASASVDGTVRIWTSDSGSSTSRNATIYCGAEVLSLEWDFKSDRLLLIGTAERGIKAWNVDAKRVVCDFATDIAFPRILDLKCSPAEPIFASAASSSGYRGHGFESKGFASLTLWNMKTWNPLTVLPLGEDPPTITSICFNHNGRMLAAGATDGLIHIFDTYGRLPITGWPAHESAVSCVKFGPDQASIFSLGADGKVFEWSLHNQGQVLQEQDASMFCRVNKVAVPRHEMALDVRGNMLLLTSNALTSPIYHLQKKQQAQRTLKHNGLITSVDWHPTQNKYITGSADHSVRITSILSQG